MAVPPELFLAGVFMGILGAALFGFSNVVYKSQSMEIQPIAINAYKMWIALPVIALVVLLFFFPTGFNVSLVSIPFLAISIILGAGIGDFLYLTSQSRIGVSRAFPIAMTFPVITYLISIVIIQEPFLLHRLLGVILAILGISIIAHEQARQEMEDVLPSEKQTRVGWDKLGIILAIGAAFSWASATVILQIGLIGGDPIDANLVRISIGSLFLLPIFLFARKRGMPMPTRRATKLVLVAGFFGMGIGSVLYVNAVFFTGATVTSVIAATAPLFALPFTVIYLKEKVTPLILLGTILTISGVWLTVLVF
ncbi:MAG: DMT family transporter [Candidatus Thorarchaeota archaeon]